MESKNIHADHRAQHHQAKMKDHTSTVLISHTLSAGAQAYPSMLWEKGKETLWIICQVITGLTH